MKKYFSFVLVFIVTLSLSFYSFGNAIMKVDAHATDCGDGTGRIYDTATGSPCSAVVTPCPATGIDPTTKKPCLKSGNSSVTDGVSLLDDLAKNLGGLKKGKNDKLKVTNLQKLLASLGLLSESDIDGLFGSLTQSKIKAFQKSHGLRVDGIIGANTIKKLNEAIKSNKNAINLLKKFKAQSQQSAEDFSTYARSTINMNDSRTWGKLVLDTPGTKDYKKDFPDGPDGSKRSFNLHIHIPDPVGGPTN